MSTADGEPKPDAGSGLPDGIPNTARTTAIVWWVLFVIFTAGIFTPVYFSNSDTEMGGWGFGVAFVCIVLSLTSIIVGIMYTKRARLVGRMLRAEGLLAHWQYTPQEWRRYTEKEHKVDWKMRKNLFLLISVIAVIVNGIFIIFEHDDWLIFVCIALFLIVLTGSLAFLTTLYRYRQNRKYLGEAFFTPNGVYLNRELHMWQGFGGKLEDVLYNKSARGISVLQIEYSIPNRYNRQSITVRVPVPQGHDEEAVKVLAALRAQIPEN